MKARDIRHLDCLRNEWFGRLHGMIPPDVTETHHAERDSVDDEGDEERFPRLLPNALAFAGVGFRCVTGISAPIANKFAVIDVHGSSLRGQLLVLR